MCPLSPHSYNVNPWASTVKFLTKGGDTDIYSEGIKRDTRTNKLSNDIEDKDPCRSKNEI